LHLQMAFTF